MPEIKTCNKIEKSAKNSIGNILFLVGLIALWLVYAIFYIVLRQHEASEICAGYLAFIGEVGLDVTTASLTLYLFLKTEGKEKTIFFLFGISFLLAIITDINYNTTVNILNITKYTARVASIFDIPFLGFLLFQLSAWIIIFLKAKPSRSNRTIFISYLPLTITAFIILGIFIWGIEWEIHTYSLIGMYIILETILQCFSFIFALLCLATALNNQIRFIAIGYLIITASDFLVHFSVLAQILEPRSFLECIWVLGALLIMFGFYGMLKNLADLGKKSWLASINSLQAQYASWSFLLCMASLTAFLLIGYFFSENMLLKVFPPQNLLSILVLFSVLAIFVSSLLAKAMSKPFVRLESIIDSYIQEKNIDIPPPKNKSKVYEFDHLENFLIKAFRVLKEKKQAQQELFETSQALQTSEFKVQKNRAIAEVAAQVSHDIRSPLAALNTVLKILSELPEEKRVLIRNATNRISDIANNLLFQYKLTNNQNAELHSKKKLKPELIASLLDSLISEKRAQSSEKAIDLILEVDSKAHGCFVKINANEFKRMISNLINNSIEAIRSNGVIRVHQTRINDRLIIKVIDNGKGISKDVLPEVKRGGISIGKDDGYGLGISAAKTNIRKWNGYYDIQSEKKSGTTFTIELPITEEPGWFQKNIQISDRTHVVTIDDDETIHNIWDMRFKNYLEDGHITLEHFYHSETFTESAANHPSKNPNITKNSHISTRFMADFGLNEGVDFQKMGQSQHKYLFLIDYELIGSEKTGLELIENLDLKDSAVLVTSRYEEDNIRERVKKLGVKIIPKAYAPHIPIIMEIPKLEIETQCPKAQKQILNPPPETSTKIKQQNHVSTPQVVEPDLIFIDDDKMLTKAWEQQAILANKNIKTFNSFGDFEEKLDYFNKKTPIYIDSSLGESIRGEEYAKHLHSIGFQNLYLATGHPKSHFADLDWIKEIVTKYPPF